MKALSKISLVIAMAGAAYLAGSRASAQVTWPETIATWSFSGVTANNGGTPPAPYTNNTVPPGGENVIIFPVTKGAGVGTTTGSDDYGGNTWTNTTEASAIATSNYMSYAIQAASGYSISFSTNFVYLHASSTGPHNVELQYSSDGVTYVDVTPLTIASGTTSVVWTNNLSTNAFLQDIPSTTTNYFRFVAWGGTGTAGTFYLYDPPPAGTAVGTNDLVIQGSLSSPAVNPPTDLVVTPTNVIANAGQTVGFTVSAAGYPASYAWYQIANSATNPVSGATSATLTLANVLGGNAGNYFVVLDNSAGSATSAVVTLIITNDPIIRVQPSDTYGLTDGTVDFSVQAFGTAPISYQWYFTDTNGDLIAPANNGSTTASGAVIAGQGTGLISLSDIQASDRTNFVVVISNTYGSQTSSVASLLDVTNVYFTYEPPYLEINPPITPIAFWDFNGSIFTNTALNPSSIATPSPYLGAGTAMAVGACVDPGTSPFSGAVDPNDNPGFDLILPGIDHLPNFSWGTDNYPLNSSNKQNGVQFNVSTVGAKNILLTYDSRVSATASDYERVQYTTNRTTWIDYPSSSTFGTSSTTYVSYQNDFSGFPGVANNPNFGVRIVTEVQYTATYGIIATNGLTNYVGTGNSYLSGASATAAAGTVTYDLVGLFGDAITNNNAPPVISPFTNAITLQVITNTTFETTLDTVPVTNVFTVSGDANPANFTYSAVSLNPATVNPTFAISVNSAGVGTMVITPNTVEGANAAAGPIVMSVTDTNGDVTKAWFDLTLVPANPAPTNTLTLLTETNTLVNTALAIPFRVGSVSNSVHQFTYVTSSGNNTVVPSANVVVVTNGIGTPTNPVVTITPANNQLGVAIISVTVNDNNATDPKNTEANVQFMVRPNTNVLAIDYFNYDASGALDTVAGGFWSHLSGNFHQMQVSSSPSGGSVTLDTVNNTENLQTPLIGAPYATNSGAILYYSFFVNLPGTEVPTANGTYITAFNDGSGNTADVNDLLVVATNGAAPGYYRIGIANDGGATAESAAMFPQDLAYGSNYLIVTSLSVTNGKSTVWLNPTNSASPHVSAAVDSGTVAYKVADFELRESGADAGAVDVSYVKVGTTFNSVLQLPVINFAPTYIVPFGSTFTLPVTNLSATAGWTDPNSLILSLIDVGPTSFNGTNVTTDGLNIYYGGGVVSYDNFNYTISDGYFTASSSVFLKPVLQMNGAETVNVHGNPVISGTSPVGAANFTYGMEDTTNLLTGPWIEAGNVTVGPTGTWNFTDLNHTNPPAIFYRIYFPDNPANPPQ